MAVQFKSLGKAKPLPCEAICYLNPLLELAGEPGQRARVLDVGCGTGAVSAEFAKRGCHVIGIDLDEDLIRAAREDFPDVRFEILAADDQLLDHLHEPPFDLVISTEVIEHLYAPREMVAGCFHALRPGGRVILSTPYHGYLKNLLIALLGKFDHHVNPLWDGGHIKFFSVKTLSRLLSEIGFRNIRFRGAGRLPYLWKSMVISGDRPAD